MRAFGGFPYNNIKFFRVIIIRFLRTSGVSDYQFHIVILVAGRTRVLTDRKSTRLNSSH